MTRYIIRGGLEGKKRLEMLARALWPTTARLLEAAGLAPGMTCLDLGCGGGDVAFELARLVGPTGTVMGADMDDVKLDAARSAARRAGLTNLHFRQSDVREWDEPGRYDLIGEPELHATIDALTRFTDDPRTVIGFPRIFQLWGREA